MQHNKLSALELHNIQMANFIFSVIESNMYDTTLLQFIWWKYCPGKTIKVRWPSGEVEVGPNSRKWDGVSSGELRQIVNSADPNDHYRPWLEKNVGKQGWDWDWMGNDIRADSQAGTYPLTIKFRKGKTKWAVMAALLWV